MHDLVGRFDGVGLVTPDVSCRSEMVMAPLHQLRESYAGRLRAARARAVDIADSGAYRDFVEVVRAKTPGRFNGGKEPNGFLHRVDQHLAHFVPKLLASVDRDIQDVFDFGCGTGASSIALAMVFPGIRCHGTDISAADVSIACERARLYGVSDRCRFDCVGEDQPLPVPSDQFDLCMCCSVLEYVADPEVRKFCVQEMARVVAPGGLLFMAVPNRLYPIELHSLKRVKARIVGSDAWEVKKLARPHVLTLHNTPLHQLFRPWTNFCLKKEG